MKKCSIKTQDMYKNGKLPKNMQKGLALFVFVACTREKVYTDLRRYATNEKNHKSRATFFDTN